LFAAVLIFKFRETLVFIALFILSEEIPVCAVHVVNAVCQSNTPFNSFMICDMKCGKLSK